MPRGASARRSLRDDIPVARRSAPTRTRAKGGGFRLFIAMLLVCGAGAGAVYLGLDLSSERGQDRPSSVARLPRQPSSDGRLLGHFPYLQADRADLIGVAPGIELHVDAADALGAMRQAAAADGVDLRLLSGFRSTALQNSIFFDVASERNQTAEERARVSAPPGYSEHSTGYAVDLGDGDAPETNLSVSFEQTRSFRWLQDHAARYHFVLSFPDGNRQGVSYEPWHWRYEGTADALRLFESARRFTRARF
ncbi:MAG: M15 family metallopeptidase [Synechococcus sp.]